MSGASPEHMAHIRSLRSPDFGKKVAKTTYERYGEDFYARIGAMGGKLNKTGGFASKGKGSDGLTGRQRAIVAGAKGGSISKRGPIKKPSMDIKNG